MWGRQHCNIKRLQNLICVSSRGGAYTMTQLAPSRPFSCKSTLPSGGGSDVSIGYWLIFRQPTGRRAWSKPSTHRSAWTFCPEGKRIYAEIESEAFGRENHIPLLWTFSWLCLKVQTYGNFAVVHVSSCSARHATEESTASALRR